MRGPCPRVRVLPSLLTLAWLAFESFLPLLSTMYTCAGIESYVTFRRPTTTGDLHPGTGGIGGAGGAGGPGGAGGVGPGGLYLHLKPAGLYLQQHSQKHFEPSSPSFGQEHAGPGHFVHEHEHPDTAGHEAPTESTALESMKLRSSWRRFIAECEGGACRRSNRPSFSNRLETESAVHQPVYNRLDEACRCPEKMPRNCCQY